jgi:hypothetical protein
MENKINNFVLVATAQAWPLSAEFEMATEGDSEFRSELMALMIDNIHELTQSLVDSNETNNPELFRRTCHKVKPTIAMIDAEFSNIIEVLKSQVNNTEFISAYHKMSANIIEHLERG